MKNKKYFIMILCIIALFSMQFVCASDNTDIDVLAGAEDSVLSAPSVTKSYTDLKAVIDDASDGDEIILDYNYKYGGNDPKSGINITKNLIINGNGAVIDGASASSLFNISEGVTVTLKNLSIQHAAALSGWNPPFTYLPAINSNGNLYIDNCTFDSNDLSRGYSADVKWNGSVIHSTKDVFINNSVFTNNVVQNNGVIYTTGHVFLNNSRFVANKAASSNSKGGVIYTEGGIDLIENCYFENNAANEGKSIYIAGSSTTLSIKNSIFNGGDNNYAPKGGAIYTDGKIRY